MHLCFKPTDPDGKDHVRVALEAMTVIVGPNGAGKSELLREIADPDAVYTYHQGFCNGTSRKILRCIHTSDPRPSLAPRVHQRMIRALVQYIEALRSPEPRTYDAERQELISRLLSSAHLSMKFTARNTSQEGDLANQLRGLFENRLKEDPSIEALAEHMLSEHLVVRPGLVSCRARQHRLQDRLTFFNDEASSPLTAPGPGPLIRLLTTPSLLASINRHLEECCGFKLLIDPSQLTFLRAVTYTDSRRIDSTAIPLDRESLRRLSSLPPLREQSDGTRFFASMIAQAYLSDADIILFDEPETSLHPPLARQLGQILTNLAEERSISIIAATHSADFLAGCLSTRHPVSICRLEYRNRQGSARPLAPAALATMHDDPLLRSTGMMSALFHRAAIVCEGPSDRALYGEVNDRLAHYEPDHPRLMRDCLFVDVNGKSAIPKVLGHLRATGIPIACIVDLDILLDTRLLERFLKELDVHEVAVKTLSQMRENVAVVFKSRDEVKKGGISNLSPRDASVVRMFIRSVAEHGIFVPENGTLEHWFPEFDVPRGERSKSEFVPAVFEKMGPIGTGLRPGLDDIWAFIRQIARYLDAYVPPPASPTS